MVLNQIFASVDLTPHEPFLPVGGGSLRPHLERPAQPSSPAVHRSRQLRQPVVFSDLSPQQKTQILARVIEHCGEETLSRWAKRDLSPARWQAVRAAYFAFVCGHQRSAVGR